MSDKKEIATLSIKISVDSTDLDKLEAQLKRITGLMVDVGLKQPASVGFSADMFFIKNGQVFIDAPLITEATVKPTVEYTVSGLHSDEYKEDLKQAVKQAIRPVIRQHIKVERSESILKSPAGITRLEKTVSHEESEFDKYKQQVEANFNQLQASITTMQCTQAASEQAIAQNLTRLQREVTSINKIAEAAKAQEEALVAAIKKTIAEDIARGGRMFRGLR